MQAGTSTRTWRVNDLADQSYLTGGDGAHWERLGRLKVFAPPDAGARQIGGLVLPSGGSRAGCSVLLAAVCSDALDKEEPPRA